MISVVPVVAELTCAMETRAIIYAVLSVLWICSLVSIRAQQQQINANDPYWHKEILDPKGRYQLEWQVDWTHERVKFNVTVATRGYVALGLAKNGKMEGADIVIGGVASNGRPYLRDHHAVGNQQPIPDKQQDWILHSAWESWTHTFLSFSRPFDTCDEHDIPINDDAIFVIWAYGERDNLPDYHYHNRGAYLTYLRDPDLTPRSINEFNQNEKTKEGGVAPLAVERVGDAQRWAIEEQFQIPAKRTTYWCNLKKFSPPTPGKHHMIGYNVRLNPEVLQIMHHMLLYRCIPPPGVNPALLFQPLLGNAGQECYSFTEPLGPIPTMFCSDLVLGHAIGGKPIFFPEHVGIPLGETNAEEYYLLQVHYDNAAVMANITSDIKMDLYYTSNLRENDGSILSLGHHIPASPSILLPPGEMNHRFYGHCSPSCTRKMLPPQGIKFLGGLLHSHTAGRRIRIQHFRNDRELPWMLNDDNYKFQFQPVRLMRNEVTVLPGDQVTVQCYYDTTLANKTTVGGYATDQEMCKTFLLYYEKLESYPICRSEINSNEYMARYLAGTTNVTWDVSRLENVATLPVHLAGMTLSNISDSRFVNWDINSRNQLRRDHIVQPQQTVCPSLTEAVIAATLGIEAPPDFVTFPVHATEYQPPQRCTLGASNYMTDKIKAKKK